MSSGIEFNKKYKEFVIIEKICKYKAEFSDGSVYCNHPLSGDKECKNNCYPANCIPYDEIKGK